MKFDTHQVGQGVVYNVIVYDPTNQMEAAYSPVVTYAGDNLKRKFLSTSITCITGALKIEKYHFVLPSKLKFK